MHSAALGRILARHGLELRLDVLRDSRRTFVDSVRERRRRQQPVTGRLHKALDRLETALAARA
jgi:hypothetical protein